MSETKVAIKWVDNIVINLDELPQWLSEHYPSNQRIALEISSTENGNWILHAVRGECALCRKLQGACGGHQYREWQNFQNAKDVAERFMANGNRQSPT